MRTLCRRNWASTPRLRPVLRTRDSARVGSPKLQYFSTATKKHQAACLDIAIDHASPNCAAEGQTTGLLTVHEPTRQLPWLGDRTKLALDRSRAPPRTNVDATPHFSAKRWGASWAPTLSLETHVGMCISREKPTCLHCRYPLPLHRHATSRCNKRSWAKMAMGMGRCGAGGWVGSQIGK